MFEADSWLAARRGHRGGNAVGRRISRRQARAGVSKLRFGADRRAGCRLRRIVEKEIRLREPIQTPDALIVQDLMLFRALDVTEGLKGNGYLIVNTARDLFVSISTALSPGCRPGTSGRAAELAVKFVGRPAPNTALLGAFAEVGIVSLESLLEAIRARLSRHGRRSHVEAAKAAHAMVAARAAA